ncbi:MAG: glycosyltransferase family 4 protein [Prevotella sp.]
MKIVVTGTRGIPNVMGGVETHCEELFPRMAAMGEEVTLIRRSSYVNDGLTEWKGVKLVDVATPKKKSFEAIVHTFRAINVAKRLGADVLHVHAIGPALLVPYARLLGMKVVFTHHGPDYDRDKWGKAAKMILKLGERMGCKFANEVIVISDVIKNLIARKYGRTEHVHLIYNGVPSPEICDYPEYFEELGIEKGRYILGMCRFVPEKNLHHLVEAYASLMRNEETKFGDRRESQLGMRNCKLVLAGDTDFEDEYSRGLKEMARKNGVVLTGFIKGRKLHSLLTNCRCYCLPSSHEGLPIALLEAMSYKVPVVVSDIPANLEVGLPKEDYFPCGDVEALAEKLTEVVSKPLQKVEYDMGKYDWDKIARQVTDVYKGLNG